MEEIHWEIPRISDEPIQLTVNNGDQLFIVGANGSGKSSLMQRLTVTAGDKKIKRITAHRQTWFNSGNINFTPANRQEYNRNALSYNTHKEARWKDLRPGDDLSALLFDLVAKDNAINESIAQHIRNKDADQAFEESDKSPSPFNQINEMLARGKLSVALQ